MAHGVFHYHNISYSCFPTFYNVYCHYFKFKPNQTTVQQLLLIINLTAVM